MFKKRSRSVENETNCSITAESKLFFAEKPVGLGIADAALKGDTGLVFFASKLKIQIPSPTNSLTEESHLSPILEFGIKTKNSNLSLFSPCGNNNNKSSNQLFLRSLSAKDIDQLSEDYTCVISHGPNPKTIHIFDDYVFENFGHNSFLPSCFACKKSLCLDKDHSLIYRGEKVFFCHECCNQEMVLDQGSSV
ncbi:FCS-Like Zinc finger 8-like [Dioscorea cayenensis subsp. rotundata]|uniref:FCS-Like Zinc finger 8-like n=1 Tax=Dioscorea cayennensis subsp. rotundata TaxID=55577 RepID=A0AB40CMM0_DIOCR|nr:FCS-Like Zinc finger 8-like [Dioscorea cayenensis subsp. rotundata]